MAEPPPAPTHIIRSHSSAIYALAISNDKERLYSADGTGKVVVTSTRSLRAIAIWQAHTDSLLGVEEWGNKVITHARDNKLHVWMRIVELPASERLGGSAAVVDLPSPKLCYSMNVNALNYCRFSLFQLPKSEEDTESHALLAVPNLIDSSVADIWELPSRERLHASIGQEIQKSIFSSDPKGRNNAGIIMSLHVFNTPIPDGEGSSKPNKALCLLCANENGSVTLRRYCRPDKDKSVEGAGWETVWTSKQHVESVMAMRVSRANDFALTISADHIVGRYDLTMAAESSDSPGTVFKTKHPGNGSIAIRDDGKICAIGGWDGRIRLYSTRTFKPLGTLRYHKVNCQALEFARSLKVASEASKLEEDSDDDSDDEELTEEDKAARSRWLIAGGKDNRVTIWELITFQKS